MASPATASPACRAAAIVSAVWLTMPCPARQTMITGRSSARARSAKVSRRHERLEQAARALDDHAVAVASQLGDRLDDRRDLDRRLAVEAGGERGGERRLVAVDRRGDGSRHAGRDPHGVVVRPGLHGLQHAGHEPAGARVLRHARAHDRLADTPVGSGDERVEQRETHPADSRRAPPCTRATSPDRCSTTPSGVSSRSAPSAAEAARDARDPGRRRRAVARARDRAGRRAPRHRPVPPRSRRRRSARTAGAARRRAGRRARTGSQPSPPSRRSDVGGRPSVSGRSSSPASAFMPTPSRMTGPSISSASTPASLRPETTTSFGQRRRASTPSPCATRAAATPPTIASAASSEAGLLGRSSTDASMAAPGRVCHVRPRRPRPASWTSARTNVNAGAPGECQRPQLVLRRADALELDRSGEFGHMDTIGR